MNSIPHNCLFPAFTEPITKGDNLRSFIKRHFENARCRFASVSLPIKAMDPLACLETVWKQSHFHYYWEKPSEEFAIAAGEKLLEITASGKNRFQEAQKKIEDIQQLTEEYSLLDHSYAGMMYLGGFSFFQEVSGEEWNKFKAASFTIPKWTIVKDGKCTLLTLTLDLHTFDSSGEAFNYLRKMVSRIEQQFTIHSRRKTPPKPTTPFDKEHISVPHTEYSRWVSSVNRAKEYIQHNTFKKIVLARQVSVSHDQLTSPTQLVNRLRRQYSNCYNFLIHRPCNTTFLGSTPERLASFRNQFLLTEALAGSIDRGKTATDDSYLENKLSNSPKNKQEHDFVVHDIEQRLQPFVEDLQRSDHPEVKKLSNVQHLYTSVRARLKNDIHPLSIVEALHPTPAVGGYPRGKTASYIKKLENFNRGWYAGPIGWLNNNNRGDFAVGIRSGLLTERKARFFAGCGIVANSNAASEWDETNLKLKPMLSVLQYD